MDSEIYDFIIIGCGAVGAAVARELTLLGQKCLVLEKNEEVLGEASSGNTGHLARNFHYELARAPLEFQMTRRAATKHNSEWLSSQVNVPRKKCGLLMVAQNDEEFKTILDYEVKAKVNAEDVRIINKCELKKLEPHLELETAVAALYSPEEYVVDPFLLPLSNLYVALYHGCQLEKHCRVIAVTKEQRNGGKYWKVKAEKRDGGKSGVSFFRAAKVINCGGNYSDELDHLVPRTIDEAKPFNIQPGRGEYVVLASSNTSKKGPQRMVTQVPTKTYAGLYVFQSVYGHYVVGPTNVIQDSKVDRGCSIDSLAILEAHIRRSFPDLQDHQVIATYVGLRPRDPQNTDYQIRFSTDKTWVTLGAIRSTGLTASRAIAEYCAQNLFGSNYNSMPRKEDVVMPSPILIKDQIQVGQFTFKPMHKLSQLHWNSDNTEVAIMKSTL